MSDFDFNIGSLIVSGTVFLLKRQAKVGEGEGDDW